MAKSKMRYSCQECGAAQSKWSGQCQSCEGWNTLVEELDDAAPTQSLRKGLSLAFTDLSSVCDNPPRFLSHIAEFDRVCGGGLVSGSVVLVGGDPGIGKSTLLLQVAAKLSKELGVYYVSGEEAINQVRMRAERLNVKDSKVHLAAATSLNDIITSLESVKNNKVGVVIIDSIQTMHADSIAAAPGSVSQVRFCTQALIRFAKKRNVIVIIVGHVTKEGTIAGPRVLEHMVDAVLYFEGERGHQFRILRGVKNRFGATDEIGVFEMTQEGLQEVLNPSALFISERDEAISGSAVFAGIEGTRPLLLEVQALVAPSAFGTPRRAVVGWDNNRLAMLLAVLETRCGVNLGNRDVYLNVAGGLRIQEPAADLAVAAALLSALTDQPLPKASLFCGEVGLSGEVRGVTHLEARLKEARKLGFESVYIPTQGSSKIKTNTTKSLEIMRLGTLQELAGFFNTSQQQHNKPNSDIKEEKKRYG